MSNIIKPSGIALVALLSLASCSTLLQNRTKESTQEEQTIEITEVTPTTPIEEEIPASEPMIDSLITEAPFIEPIPIPCEDEEPERVMNVPHFEGDQTTSVVIPEYKGLIVEDMVINLGEQSSYYPADGHVTSKYGWRKGRMHAGIDLKAFKGDNLYAAFDGVVRLAKYYSSFGNCVIIRHYNGLETLYAHATKLMVEVNDEVKAGDIIALAGSTGRSTGSHLHFEVRVAGHYIDPALILDTENRKIKDDNLYITMRNGRLFASNNDSEEEREAYILSQISIRYHTVKSGDVLSRIAANNETTVATICRLNGISSKSTLRIGQRLIVRDGVRVAATTPTSAAAAKTGSTTAAPSTKAASTTSSANKVKYVVKSGDTLSEIATRNNTTTTAICNLSGISRNSRLSIGQVLYLPGGSTSSSSATTTSSNGVYHTVKSGDTLSGIAQKYNTTVSALCSLNGISTRSTLSLNQQIRVK